MPVTQTSRLVRNQARDGFAASGANLQLRNTPSQLKHRNTIWAAVKPQAVEAGWTVVSENFSRGLLVVLQYNRNGVEAWATRALFRGNHRAHAAAGSR